MRETKSIWVAMKHAEEDTYGLHCVGYVSREPLGDATLEKVRDKSLTHCSFRAGVVRDRAHFVVEEDPITGEKIDATIRRMAAEVEP